MIRELARQLLLLLLCVFGAQYSVAQSPDTAQPDAPAIQDLGNQRYRVGSIEIDKAEGEFKVSGSVLRHEPPIEFLATTLGGHKSYESLLEINSDAYEFNLACILIGLDASHAKSPGQHTVEEPMDGDPVEVFVSWIDDGKRITVKASQLLMHGEPLKVVSSHNWVYTGSAKLRDGRYLADLAGTLLGFVHRAESIIEHKEGIGLNDYGSVVPNKDLIPAVGSPIVLTIRNIKGDK